MGGSFFENEPLSSFGSTRAVIISVLSFDDDSRKVVSDWTYCILVTQSECSGLLLSRRFPICLSSESAELDFVMPRTPATAGLPSFLSRIKSAPVSSSSARNASTTASPSFCPRTQSITCACFQ